MVPEPVHALLVTPSPELNRQHRRCPPAFPAACPVVGWPRRGVPSAAGHPSAPRDIPLPLGDIPLPRGDTPLPQAGTPRCPRQRGLLSHRVSQLVPKLRLCCPALSAAPRAGPGLLSGLGPGLLRRQPRAHQAHPHAQQLEKVIIAMNTITPFEREVGVPEAAALLPTDLPPPQIASDRRSQILK